MTALSVRSLSKSFGGRKILDGVNWSMNDNARVGLVGLNGAGKSTLLRMIAEVSQADSGRIARPQRTRVGYLAQDAPEMGGHTVLQETLSALDRMQALDLRRQELEQVLTREHSGPTHDAALDEFGEVLTELERISGNERYGISRPWYEFGFEAVSIPMLGRADSLNVSISAAVLLCEARARKAGW